MYALAVTQRRTGPAVERLKKIVGPDDGFGGGGGYDYQDAPANPSMDDGFGGEPGADLGGEMGPMPEDGDGADPGADPDAGGEGGELELPAMPV